MILLSLHTVHEHRKYSSSSTPLGNNPIRRRYLHYAMPKPRGNRHRQQEVLSERPKISPGQQVVQVIRACGENIYEVETSTGLKQLYELPKRLRHIAFIRRGCFVFAKEDATRGAGRVRGDIEVVVLDCFLDDLRRQPFWPPLFSKGTRSVPSSCSADTVQDTGYAMEDTEDVEDPHSDDDWQIGGGNPNRRKWDHVSSDEESDEND